MSFKCSLLGHRFDETTVERDRQEDGSEVVTTITELETCSRCGETRVVSENKEVTTMETPDIDAGTDAGVETDPSPGPEREAGSREAADPDREHDAEILNEGGIEADAQTEARSAAIPDAEKESTPARPGAEAGGGERTDASDEDAVIIDGAEETPPDGRPRDGPGGQRHDPDAGAVEHTDDARTSRDASSSTVGAGEWPDEPEPEDDREALGEWPEETTREGSEESGISFEETASPRVTVPEGMFKCSECGFTTEVASSSLRAGDFCPACQQGTLVQHDDDGVDA
jgi:hypothetical protein